MMIQLLCLLAAIGRAAGPADLVGLKDGDRKHSFTARALYLDAQNQPKGARFVHDDGMPVDVMFFASVPQASMYAKTPTFDDKGEPHTGEHLLIGKGRVGKALNALIGMRLADHTAATYDDLTNYSFFTAAGPAGFYELLENYLNALLHPDFTDDEIRGEVANLGVDKGPDGKWRLDEKGTIYQEMLSSMEKPDYNNWDQLKSLVYGVDHPLAKSAGGLPAAIRTMTPEDIRAFHDAHYQLGSNMALIVALPMDWGVDDCLSRLDAMFGRLQPRRAMRDYPRLPAPMPQPARIAIGTFPSDDPSVPQTVDVAWKSVNDTSKEDLVRLNILLQVLAGGDSSLLYADLVDAKTRVFDSGVSGISGNVDAPPMAIPLVAVSGLPATRVTPENLARIRDAVWSRVAKLSALKSGDPELAAVAAKARSLISGARRAALKFLDDPPHFGERSAGIDWHRTLDELNAAPRFRKSVAMTEAYDRLLAEIDRGSNPWTGIARRAGLLETPYVSAVVPDPAAIERERKAKAERLVVAADSLRRRFGLADEQAALAKQAEESAAADAALARRDATIPKPNFVSDPPLTLDNAEFRVLPSPGGRGTIETLFGATPFTTVELAFDLNGLSGDDALFVSVFPHLLTDVGATTAAGEELDYVRATERVRSEIYGLGAGISANPRTGRTELILSAEASTPAEVDKAVAWLENVLLRRARGIKIRERLIDLLKQDIQQGRGIFQLPEEYWVESAASAYVWQDRPLYMAAESPFTRLRALSRLRWRLEGTTPKFDEGELGDMFLYEGAHLPSASREQDRQRLEDETHADLAFVPATTIDRVEAALDSIVNQSRARVHITGGAANADRAVTAVAGLLGKLVTGAVPPPFSPGEPLVLRDLRERLPELKKSSKRLVHVGLVNNGTKTGVHVVSADGPSYRDADRGAALDFLTVGEFAGHGPDSFFMRTWSAGLAYSNGVRPRLSSGQLRYYAERCPELSRTMDFVVGLARSTKGDDPDRVRASLASAFSDYRASRDFSSRGEALADDIMDGNAPDVVKAFKTKLLAVAAEPGVEKDVSKRIKPVLGRVLVGLVPGGVSSAAGAVDFVIGPDALLDGWEKSLRAAKETDALIRLYPRDFWP